MTIYQVPVSQELLDVAGDWQPVSGLRLVSQDGPWAGNPGMVLCMFEDDDAPPELAGKIVDLTLKKFGTTVEVTGRTVIG